MSRLETVEAWFEMCRTGDVSRVDELATSDYVTHGPGGTGDQTAFVTWLRWYPTWFEANDLQIAQQLGARISAP